MALYKIDENKQAIPIVPPSIQPTFWVPDYANQMTITLPFTAPKIGWVCAPILQGEIMINGKRVCYNANAQAVYSFVLVNKDDVVSTDRNAAPAFFYPAKLGDLS